MSLDGTFLDQIMVDAMRETQVDGFFDRCDVLRAVETDTGNGPETAWVPLYTAIPCRLAQQEHRLTNEYETLVDRTIEARRRWTLHTSVDREITSQHRIVVTQSTGQRRLLMVISNELTREWSSAKTFSCEDMGKTWRG